MLTKEKLEKHISHLQEKHDELDKRISLDMEPEYIIRVLKKEKLDNITEGCMNCIVVMILGFIVIFTFVLLCSILYFLWFGVPNCLHCVL